MRIFITAAAAALLLNACAEMGSRDSFVSHANVVPSGNWRIERQNDPVTGAPTPNAILVTSNSSNSSESFPLPALLQITCFKGQPMVRLAFQFKVGSTPNSVLGYRFDERPGRDIEARFLDNQGTVVIEDRVAVTQFVNELATSSVLRIRIRSLNGGRTAADFRLDGAPAAIDAALADCPVLPDPQRLPRRAA